MNRDKSTKFRVGYKSDLFEFRLKNVHKALAFSKKSNFLKRLTYLLYFNLIVLKDSLATKVLGPRGVEPRWVANGKLKRKGTPQVIVVTNR